MMFAEKCCNIENNSFGKKKEKKEKRHELNLFQKEKNSWNVPAFSKKSTKIVQKGVLLRKIHNPHVPHTKHTDP